MRGTQPVVAVRPEPQVDAQILHGDGVLPVEALGLDRGRPVEAEQRPTTRQIVGRKSRQVCRRVRRIVERRIGDSQREVLAQLGRIHLRTELDGVPARHVRGIHLHADIGQAPILADRRRLIREWVRAGRVRDVVLPHIGVGGQQPAAGERARVAGRQVEGVDRLDLVLTGRLLIVVIRHLEPRPRELHVEMERAVRIVLPVEAIEDRFLISTIVQGRELRRIEEAIGVQPAG